MSKKKLRQLPTENIVTLHHKISVRSKFIRAATKGDRGRRFPQTKILPYPQTPKRQ